MIAWPIFGGFFLYVEKAPWFIQAGFLIGCAVDLYIEKVLKK